MLTREAVQIIHDMAATGKPATTSGRAVEGSRLFAIVPAQLAISPVDYFKDKDKINSATVIGKRSRHPIGIKMPVVAAAMSFGALSLEAKQAISMATSLVGTADNTGEGGLYPDNRKLAKILIVQYSTARFGVTREYLEQADAIEIKIGQGAKPGQGGLLPGSKVTEAIARARSTPEKQILAGQTLHSPACHPDIRSADEWRREVSWLREITDGKPIIVKLGAGNVERDVAYALVLEPDVIAIDGREGGTGAAPRVMLDGMGIPAFPALVRARRCLDEMKSKRGFSVPDVPELWIGGGFNLGEEVAWALALGADVVFLGTALMIAAGCGYCRKCHEGKCKLGITTHVEDPAEREKGHIKKLDPLAASEMVAKYLTALTEEVKMIAGAVGLDDVYALRKENIEAFDPFVAEKTGVKTVWG